MCDGVSPSGVTEFMKVTSKAQRLLKVNPYCLIQQSALRVLAGTFFGETLQTQ